MSVAKRVLALFWCAGAFACRAPGSSGDPAAEGELSSDLYWVSQSNLITARYGHQAALLTDGRVLVAGGYSSASASELASCELWDPDAGTWTATGSLTNGRYNFTLTALDGGTVLAAGGATTAGQIASCELYNPATGKWTLTGSLATARSIHTATLLPNGKVLVAGGASAGAALNSAELYDPADGGWSSAGTFTGPRHTHSAALLPGGQVLIAGGQVCQPTCSDATSASVYDPSTNSWSATGSLANARRNFTLTVAPNGLAFAVAGLKGTSALASVEVYQPDGGWADAGALNQARGIHGAALLRDGKILVVGGYNYASDLATVETYDPVAESSTTVSPLATAHGAPAASLLPDGTVLIAAGENPHNSAIASSERFDPAALLVVTSVPQSVVAGACSAPVTVETTDDAKNPQAVLVATPVSLTPTSPSTTFYSDACMTPVQSITVAPGSVSAIFYFRDTTPETLTVTLAANGYVGTAQAETILGLDAGVDAGAGDGGTPDGGAADGGGTADGGSTDGGLGDGGGADAGPADGGAFDAGISVTYAVGCGCSQPAGPWPSLILLSVLVVLDRRRCRGHVSVGSSADHPRLSDTLYSGSH